MKLKLALIPAVFFAVVAGCASSGPGPEISRRVSGSSRGPSVVREEFDPQTLNDDDFLLKPGISNIPAGAAPQRSVTAPQVPSARRTANGYRVQIAAVLDRVRADQLRARSEVQLKQRVYVIYDEQSRLYKLRVGDARTASEGESLRRSIKGKGYQEAFIVRSNIEIAPSPYRLPTAAGYRVQIFSASNRDAAERALATARRTLRREDVYIEFEPPYFKVRVGNFRSRSEAEDFVDTAKKEGYDTPFPVKTEILSETR